MLNPEDVTYELPEMKLVLSSTNGIIVFQEQTMILTRILAGFTPGQADKVRKGMGKKIRAIIDEYGEYFIHGSKQLGIKGCVANGISESTAKGIWEKMEKFSEYAFNKSHSVAYSVLTMRTAWLSYYYPIEYMTAVLNSYISNIDKIKVYLSTCKSKGIEVLGPNINYSQKRFSISEGKIRFGLEGIMRLGSNSYAIIDEREKNGKYTDLQNFLSRLPIEKDSLIALILSGSLDDFRGNRKEKMDQLDILLDYIKSTKVINSDKNKQIYNLIGLNSTLRKTELVAKTNTSFPKKYMLNKEFEYTSFYITGHPLDDFNLILKKTNAVKFESLKDAVNNNDDMIELYSGKKVSYNSKNISFIGVVTEAEAKISKTGNTYLCFKIEDYTTDLDARLYKTNYIKYGEFIQKGEVVSLNGKVEVNDFGITLIVNDVMVLDSDIKGGIKEIALDNDFYTKTINIFNKLPEGETTVVYTEDGKEFKKLDHKISLKTGSILALQKLIGNQNLKFKYKDA